MENKDIVNVTRYIRPEARNPWEPTLPKNLFGITIDFLIDYQEDTVKARWSVCSNENFSRKVGVEQAAKNQYLYTFPLRDVDDCAGLIYALIKNLREDFTTKAVFSDYEFKHKLFSKALRHLKGK